jgi:hypothetical protein
LTLTLSAPAESRHRLDLRVAPLGGGRDVEDHDLVGALRFVPRRLLGGVAGVAQVLEPNAFHHTAVPHVQAGDEAPQQTRRAVRGRPGTGGATTEPALEQRRAVGAR